MRNQREFAPLKRLVREFPGGGVSSSMAALATQLGLLPDLRYLLDGLGRSRQCIEAQAMELAECLRAVPGDRLEPEGLLQAIDQLVDWVNVQAWDRDDVRMLAMSRADTLAKHPLSGYCLSVSFHWANLFYTREPHPAEAESTAALPYESLMGEFSAYVLAAQSTIESKGYLDFCDNWWATGQLPPRAPYPSRRLASRVAGASRAMRQISLVEHAELFTYLTDRTEERFFHERVASAQRRVWGEDDQRVVDAVARLLEEVRLGWYRPANFGSRGSRKGPSASRRVVHRSFRDGFVRVAGQPAILLNDTTDDGWAFEYVVVAPDTLEGLTREKLRELEDATAAAQEDDTTSLGRCDDEDTAASNDLRERAMEEAEIALDGLEWFPAEEATGHDCLEAIVLGEVSNDQTAATAPNVSSRGAAEHIRRHHFAHHLVRDRLTPREARELLASLRAEPADSPYKEVLIGLHACLALGRPLPEIVSKLRICEGTVRPGLSLEEIHYALDSRQWVIPCPAPAWQEMDRTPDELVQWSQLWLNDQTDFCGLLHHFGFAKNGRPLQKLTDARNRSVSAFLRRALPKSDITPQRCAGFLFHQILATQQGDLGLACLITGQCHSHGSSVGHYANYRAPRVWEAYRDAWRASDRPQHAVTRPVVESRGGYGAKRVPTTEAVKRLLASLQTTALSAQDSHRNNAYVSYTLAGLVLGLGMRPVVEPKITSVAESVRRELVLSLVDKARTDYHRRINAIPPGLTEHLLHYVAFNPRRPQGSPRAAYVFPYTDPDTGEHVRFRPTHFQAVAAPQFTLELYALRRFARTYLKEVQGVHGEDLDAYMGHWLHRVSPHDPLSTYPMRRLSEMAQGPVQRMLEAVGFAPLRLKA